MLIHFRVEVFDADKLGKDKSLGIVEINPSDLDSYEPKWYPLKVIFVSSSLTFYFRSILSLTHMMFKTGFPFLPIFIAGSQVRRNLTEFGYPCWWKRSLRRTGRRSDFSNER